LVTKRSIRDPCKNNAKGDCSNGGTPEGLQIHTNGSKGGKTDGNGKAGVQDACKQAKRKQVRTLEPQEVVNKGC